MLHAQLKCLSISLYI